MEPYRALALQPVVEGAKKRDEYAKNLKQMGEMIDAAIWLSGLEPPVRLVAIPEGAIQGYTGELFERFHADTLVEMSLEIPGEETMLLGEKAKEFNIFIIAQAAARHSQFPGKSFNCVFIIDPRGEVVHRHYKPQIYRDGHSAVPADIWARWMELYGYTLQACYPVTDTAIGRIGTLSCMEGSPEAARGLVMNGAEIIYKPSFLQSHVATELWQGLNRIRALDNTCYFVSPKVDNNQLLAKAISFKNSPSQALIADYKGRIISEPNYGPGFVFAGGIIDIRGLRDYREMTIWDNWLEDLRTPQYRIVYEDMHHECPDTDETVTEKRDLSLSDNVSFVPFNSLSRK